MRMTPDVPMPSEDYAEGFAAGLSSVRMIRCVKHREVLPYNANESGGGECAVCEIDAKNAEIRSPVNQKWVRKEDHDALRSDCERMREENKALREMVAETVYHASDPSPNCFYCYQERHRPHLDNCNYRVLLSRLDAAAKPTPTQDPEPCRVECECINYLKPGCPVHDPSNAGEVKP